MQTGGHARLAEDLQRSPVKRMMPARDEDALGKVLEVGSVGWCSSIRSREKLLACVKHRIADGSVVDLIGMWLNAVVVDGEDGSPGGKRTRNEKGTPQGGVISPVLANLFLHWFDVLFHGSQGPARQVGARLVRYADDLVILTRKWTPELTAWVESNLEGKFGLEINREKTRVVEVKPSGGSLDFLGYTFRWDRDLKGRRGRKYLNVFPSAKSVAREREKLRALTSAEQCHTPLPEWVDRLNRQRKGWANYYDYGYPRQAWWEIGWFVRGRLIQHLRRRSQRPYRPGREESWYEHIQSLGLVLLNQLSPRGRLVHA